MSGLLLTPVRYLLYYNGLDVLVFFSPWWTPAPTKNHWCYRSSTPRMVKIPAVVLLPVLQRGSIFYFFSVLGWKGHFSLLNSLLPQQMAFPYACSLQSEGLWALHLSLCWGGIGEKVAGTGLAAWRSLREQRFG